MDRDQYLQVDRPGNQCVLCGQSLVEQGRHPSVLNEGSTAEGDEKFQRTDFCSICWEKLPDRNYFSFWLAKRTRPESNRRLAKSERNEILWRLFSALSTHPGPETHTQLFILAHLLMKYGLLRWRSNQSDAEGVNWIVFEHAPTGEECRVREIPLGDATLIQTLQEIENLVAREVNPELSDAVSL